MPLSLALMLLTGLSAEAQDFVGNDLRDSFSGETLFPEFAHPQKDATEALKNGDFRFIALDRKHRDVPGLERRAHLKRRYGTKVIRQHLHLFLSSSQRFSLSLRARAYAMKFNQILLAFLLKQPQKK
ncbi:MAG: hypothetical protein ACR2G0_03245 [Chthoniobacterales bacterium]